MNNESNAKKQYKETLSLDKMPTENEIQHICNEFRDGWQVGIDKKVFSQEEKDLISLIMLATTKGNNSNDRI